MRERPAAAARLFGVRDVDIHPAQWRADPATSTTPSNIAAGDFERAVRLRWMLIRGAATLTGEALLLTRGDDTDLEDAQAAIDRLAAVPTTPGSSLNETVCCGCAHSLPAPAATTPPTRDYRDRYRAMATGLGFEGHMAWAEAMP